MASPCIHESMQPDGFAVFFEFEREMTCRAVEALAHNVKARYVPMHPDDAARPRPRPCFRIRCSDLFGVFAKERNLAFEINHVRLPLALGLVAGSFPQVEQLRERQDMR